MHLKMAKQIAQQQQMILEQTESHVSSMKCQVDDHLVKRRNVITFIDNLQIDERYILQQWLFQFWVITFRLRQEKIQAAAHELLDLRSDEVAPTFMAWRIFVSRVRLEKCRIDCAKVDVEASDVANRITEVETECEEQLKQLQERMEESSVLKQKVLEEQSEHHRLQRLCEETQPDLLLGVLAQSMEIFFLLIVRAASFIDLEVRHKLQWIDVSALVENLNDVADMRLSELLLRWINLALDTSPREDLVAFHALLRTHPTFLPLQAIELPRSEQCLLDDQTGRVWVHTAAL